MTSELCCEVIRYYIYYLAHFPCGKKLIEANNNDISMTVALDILSVGFFTSARYYVNKQLDIVKS